MSWLCTAGPVACLAIAACGSAPPADLVATPWPEADAMFQGNARWRGGDAAYSVDLGNDRVLWLFGDSFVRSDDGPRRGARMVRNTIAVQDGQDPDSARMTFHWNRTDGEHAAFFPGDGDEWFWPLHGLREGVSVTVFGTRVVRTEAPGVFGFRAVGWTAFRIDGIDGPVSVWRMRRLETPAAPFPVVVGTALVRGSRYVYAYALQEPGDHAVYLLRWPVDAFSRGELDAPEWWDAGRWRQHAELIAAPTPVLPKGAPEFTVVADPRGGLCMVQTVGFGATTLGVRRAERPEGPWSAVREVYRPPESDRDGVFVYAGKGHVLGGALVATYASNAWDFGALVADESLYYPRVVQLSPGKPLPR